MKHLIRMAVLVAFCLGFFSLGAYAEETVINKDGQPVLLKDDNTWELVDTSGDDGKVIFRIIDGVDSHASYASKDDFDKITHHVNFAGCLYKVEAENRTKHTVKVDYFSITQNDIEMFPRGHMAYAFYQYHKVLEPGQKEWSTGSAHQDKPLLAWTDLETKQAPTDKEIEALIERYGCKAQTGKIYLEKSGTDQDIVIFSSDSGISGAAVRAFVKTSQTGVYPLQKKIRW